MDMQEFMGLLATYGAAEVRLTVEVTRAEVLPAKRKLDEDVEECCCEKVEDSTCSGNCGETGCCPPGHFCENRCANTEGVPEKCEGGCSNDAANRALFGCSGSCAEKDQSKTTKTAKLPTEEDSGNCVAQVVRVSVRKV